MLCTEWLLWLLLGSSVATRICHGDQSWEAWGQSQLLTGAEQGVGSREDRGQGKHGAFDSAADVRELSPCSWVLQGRGPQNHLGLFGTTPLQTSTNVPISLTCPLPHWVTPF
jgi:hypothetical protein